MMKLSGPIDNQRGAVFIVVAVLLLALLMLTGKSILKTVVSESAIAVNLHLHRMAFYEAEGGAYIGMQLIEDNIYHRGRTDGEAIQGVTLDDGDFYLNGPLPGDVAPDRQNRVAHYPDPDSHPPFTRIMIGGTVSLAEGNAIQMFSGYRAVGHGVAAGGVRATYHIRSRHVGKRKNESIVEVIYRHVP
jgi:hypothetical protein